MTDTPTTVGAVPGASSAPVDPSQYTPFTVPVPLPKFEWTKSDYSKAVLGDRGLLHAPVNGSGPRINDSAFNNLLAPIMMDRQVTEANLDQIAVLGVAEIDIPGLVYGRSAQEAAIFRAETDWLVKEAWKRITNKGDVAKSGLLPRGFVLVESGKDELSRVVTGPDGRESSLKVQVRVATNVPERFRQYVTMPAAERAKNSVAKAVKEIREGADTFPKDAALFQSQLTTMVATIQGELAPAFQKFGLELNPITWNTPGIGAAPRRKLARVSEVQDSGTDDE